MKAEKETLKGIFVQEGNDWIYNLEKLAELTSAEFADAVKEEFDNMVQTNYDFHAEVYRMDYSKVHESGVSNIYVCIGHFIYTHIHIFNEKSKNFRYDILNLEYYQNIVNPFMKQFKKR